ncbi:hypothetical protein AB1K83_07415 [Sporosarcina sp. 179-K 3D1 HS]
MERMWTMGPIAFGVVLLLMALFAISVFITYRRMRVQDEMDE